MSSTDQRETLALAEAARLMTQLALFMQRHTDLCIRCGRQVTSLEKRGRCVYALRCGCRLWQGEVPAAWNTPKEGRHK